MAIVLILFAVAFVIKLSLNAFRLIATYHCYRMFKKRTENLGQCIELADRLFSAAGTNLLVHESTWNQDVYHRISYFLTDKDQRKNIDLVFQRTIGVYKIRALDCINLFYWVFLPKHIFKHFGYEPSKIIISLSTIFYWILSTVGAVILEAVVLARYGDCLNQFVDMLP